MFTIDTLHRKLVKKASTGRFRGDTGINITLISPELITASHGVI